MTWKSDSSLSLCVHAQSCPTFCDHMVCVPQGSLSIILTNEIIKWNKEISIGITKVDKKKIKKKKLWVHINNLQE